MLCPKCHQPIDGEEEYVCCANAVLQWRCTGCAKVSEGFAFPYGMCPHCGGRLEALDRGEVADTARDAVRTAFEIELGGRDFYTQAARETADPALKDLFGHFAAMEEEHMATLSRRYHAAVPAPAPELRVDLAALYAGIDSRPAEPGNLFRLAIAFEQRAARFFTERSEQVPEDSAERQLYRELAAEERDHAALLATEYERWKAGKPGLL